MEPIRLWRNGDSAIFVRGAVDANLLRYRPDAVEYAALPRAEYDALVARTEKPLDHVMRTSCGHEWTVRHTACPRCFDALRAERDSLVMERNKARGAARVCREDAEINAARAEKAEARLARAEALLREARVWVHDGVMGRFTPRSCAETVMARIDAHLDGTA